MTNRNLSRRQFGPKRFEQQVGDYVHYDDGMHEVVQGKGARAEIVPPQRHGMGRERDRYFVGWIDGSGGGAGTNLVSHYNAYSGARPEFSDPEENTESGNAFIESLRRKGLAD